MFAEKSNDVVEASAGERRRVSSRSTLVIVPSPREFHLPVRFKSLY